MLTLYFQVGYVGAEHIKVKVLPQQATRGPRCSGYFKAPDFLTFGATSVVGCQFNAPATFTHRRIPGTHF
jgi:hypothetical protein